MKRVYVNEKWCLSCHLCEYYCAFASTGGKDMALVLKDIEISPRIRIEEMDGISLRSHAATAMSPFCERLHNRRTFKERQHHNNRQGKVHWLLYLCIILPYGAVQPSDDGAIQKCELCIKTHAGVPQCVLGCPTEQSCSRKGA